MRFSLAFKFVLLLIPTLCLADQTDSRLEELFDTLQQTNDPALIQNTENRIWEIWMRHENEDVERLMQMAVQRMNSQLYPESLLILNQLVETFPAYAEAWNRRATLFYLVGNLEASIADIEATLALEPRHFGALSGLGMVYLQRDELGKAKQAFENLVEVHPNSPNAQQNLQTVIESLLLEVI